MRHSRAGYLTSSFACCLLEVFNAEMSVFKDTMSASMPCMMQSIRCRMGSETPLCASPSAFPPRWGETPSEGEAAVETDRAARRNQPSGEEAFSVRAFALAPFRATFLLLVPAHACTEVACFVALRRAATAVVPDFGGCLSKVGTSEQKAKSENYDRTHRKPKLAFYCMHNRSLC